MSDYEMLEFDEQYFKDNYLQPHNDLYQRSWSEIGYFGDYEEFKDKLLNREYPLEIKQRAYLTDTIPNLINFIIKAKEEGMIDEYKLAPTATGRYQSAFLTKSKIVQSHDKKASLAALRSSYSNFIEETNTNTIECIKADMEALRVSEDKEREELENKKKAKQNLLEAAAKYLK